MEVFTNLKAGPLVAAAVVVLAVIAGATVLAWHGTMTGSDWLIVISPILAAVTGITTAHVVGNTVANAALSPPVGTTPDLAPRPGPAGGPQLEVKI